MLGNALRKQNEPIIGQTSQQNLMMSPEPRAVSQIEGSTSRRKMYLTKTSGGSKIHSNIKLNKYSKLKYVDEQRPSRDNDVIRNLFNTGVAGPSESFMPNEGQWPFGAIRNLGADLNQPKVQSPDFAAQLD